MSVNRTGRRRSPRRLLAVRVAGATLATTLSAAAPLHGGESPDPAVSLVLGGVAWPVVFEGDEGDGDHELAELRAQIVADLTGVYGRFAEYRLNPPATARQVTAFGEVVAVTGVLDFSISQDYFIPDPLRSSFGFVAPVRGRDHIVIPTSLVAGYRAAAEFERANRAALDELPRFIARFNDLSVAAEIDTTSLIAIYYMDHLTPSRRQRLVTSAPDRGPNPYHGQRLLAPGMLAVRDGVPDDLPAGTLVADAALEDIATGRFDEIPLIGDGAEWQVVLPYGE